jgi:hypothetical protein
MQRPAIRQLRVLYFRGCPHAVPTLELVRRVASQLGTEASLELIEVGSDEEAHRLGFLGSPTVQVDGIDIDPGARERTDRGMACRLYDGAGVPPEAMISAALRNDSR